MYSAERRDMPVLKMTGRTLDECKAKLFEKFNNEYTICGKRTMLKGGFFGIGQKEVVEVSYTVDREEDVQKNTAAYTTKLSSGDGTDALERECEAAGADIALYGHTHIAAEIRRSVYIVNPGSISYPRSLTPPSFAVLELDGKNSNAVFYRIDVRFDGMHFTPFTPKKTSLWI